MRVGKTHTASRRSVSLGAKEDGELFQTDVQPENDRVQALPLVCKPLQGRGHVLAVTASCCV